MADQNAIDSRQPQTASQRIRASISAFQGPLPPPEMLERYNQVVPNGAERIIAMPESQVRHRHALESAVVNGSVRAEQRGQIFAFILVSSPSSEGSH